MHLLLLVALFFTLACDSKASEDLATEPSAVVAKSKSIDAAPVVAKDASPVAKAVIPDAARVVAPPPDTVARVARRNKDDEDAKIAEAISNTAIVAILTGGEGGAFGSIRPTEEGFLKESISMAGGPADPEQPSSRIKVTVQSVSGFTPNKGEVEKRIRAKYSFGLKRCHQRVLKTDPKTAGTLIGSFVIGPTGRVTSSSFSGLEKQLSACIQSTTKRWRFSAPKDAEGAPTQADVKLTLILSPG